MILSSVGTHPIYCFLGRKRRNYTMRGILEQRSINFRGKLTTAVPQNTLSSIPHWQLSCSCPLHHTVFVLVAVLSLFFRYGLRGRLRPPLISAPGLLMRTTCRTRRSWTASLRDSPPPPPSLCPSKPRHCRIQSTGAWAQQPGEQH